MEKNTKVPIGDTPDLKKIIFQIAFIFTLIQFGQFYFKTLSSFSFFANNSFHLFVTGTWFLHQLVFWSGNIFLTYLDISEKPAFLYKYKIQNKKIGTKGHWKCLWVVLFNQIILLPIMLLIGWYISEEQIPGKLLSSEISINYFQLFLKLVIFALIEEIGFYYSHRLIHCDPLYGQIHKIHHEFKYPVGTASEYAHPIEFLISNVFPLLAGPLLCQYLFGELAIFEIYFWSTLAITATINGHSGFEFPYAPFKSARFHDLHHEVFTDNYGALGLLDWLHGTRRIPTIKVD